jgi:hypothetical protein
LDAERRLIIKIKAKAISGDKRVLQNRFLSNSENTLKEHKKYKFDSFILSFSMGDKNDVSQSSNTFFCLFCSLSCLDKNWRADHLDRWFTFILVFYYYVFLLEQNFTKTRFGSFFYLHLKFLLYKNLQSGLDFIIFLPSSYEF